MKLLVRFPLVFALASFVLNFVVCSFGPHDKTEGPFRFGESIIRYGEEMERMEKYQPSAFDEKETRSNLL